MSSENRPPSTATPEAPADVVEMFLEALRRLDVASARALMHPGITYQNVSLPAARGRDATVRVLRPLNRTLSQFEIETHRLAVNGPVVLTERTDVVVIGPLRISFWVCGTFEVHDGRITLWRDYFDWAAVLRATATGVVRMPLSLITRRSG